MTEPTGKVIRPPQGKFITRSAYFELLKGEQMRRDMSMHYLLSEVIRGGVSGPSFFAGCREFAAFAAKLKEAIVFLASESGRHGFRCYSVPLDRVFVAVNGFLTELPTGLNELALLTQEERRLFFFPDTQRREIFCTGVEEIDALTLYNAFVESFGLSHAKIRDLPYPSLVLIPLATQQEALGVAVVAGPRPNFLDPRVDLDALRWLGQHAGEMLRENGLA